MLQGAGKSLQRARRLRSEMTMPEVLLWQRLRTRPNGLKFRRQHPAGRYVVDFYCHDLRLIVEVDGKGHDMGDRPEVDRVRDKHFLELGFRVMRIGAGDVLRDADEAVASIVAQASAVPPRIGEAI